VAEACFRCSRACFPVIGSGAKSGGGIDTAIVAAAFGWGGNNWAYLRPINLIPRLPCEEYLVAIRVRFHNPVTTNRHVVQDEAQMSIASLLVSRLRIEGGQIRCAYGTTPLSKLVYNCVTFDCAAGKARSFCGSSNMRRAHRQPQNQTRTLCWVSQHPTTRASNC